MYKMNLAVNYGRGQVYHVDEHDQWWPVECARMANTGLIVINIGEFGLLKPHTLRGFTQNMWNENQIASTDEDHIESAIHTDSENA